MLGFNPVFPYSIVPVLVRLHYFFAGTFPANSLKIE